MNGTITRKRREIEEIGLGDLEAHPLNRQFPREGGDWAELVRSIAEHGIIQPLVVRRLATGKAQILAGHRRAEAAVECGLETAPCLVRELDDRQAMEFLLVENLHRSDLDPVEEAVLVSAMLAQGRTAEELSRKISRSVEWVALRQGVLDLGTEVREALRVPRGERGHLTIGAAAVLLAVPVEERPRAEQLVLHPDWQDEPLGARDAEAAVRKLVLDPMRGKAAWEKQGTERKRAWRELLSGLLPNGEEKELAIVLAAYDDTKGGWDVDATGKLPAEEVTHDGTGRTWVELAVRHGLAVRVIRGEDTALAVVDSRLLRHAEEARAESGLETWLKAKKTPIKARLDPDTDPNYDPEEPAEPVATPGDADGVKISQIFEHYAMMNIGEVKRVAMWAMSTDADPATAPDFVPKVIREMAFAGEWDRIDAVCNWFLSLKGGAE